MKLLDVRKSDRSDKKLVAEFETEKGGTKKVHFGAKGYSDYTVHKDPKRRENYIARHKKNENWNDPTTAGSLSKHLLWGDSTSLQQNLKAFKKKFKI